MGRQGWSGVVRKGYRVGSGSWGAGESLPNQSPGSPASLQQASGWLWPRGLPALTPLSLCLRSLWRTESRRHHSEAFETPASKPKPWAPGAMLSSQGTLGAAELPEHQAAEWGGGIPKHCWVRLGSTENPPSASFLGEAAAGAAVGTGPSPNSLGLGRRRDPGGYPPASGHPLAQEPDPYKVQRDYPRSLHGPNRCGPAASPETTINRPVSAQGLRVRLPLLPPGSGAPHPHPLLLLPGLWGARLERGLQAGPAALLCQ